MHALSVRLIDDDAGLADLAEPWHALAGGVLFREPLWLHAWWRHYGAIRSSFAAKPQLAVAVVRRQEAVVGVAPWYVDRSPAAGRVLRWLGSGEVCSDYLTVLARPGDEDDVAAALADYLVGPYLHRWDRVELDGVAADDPVVAALVRRLAVRGAAIDRRPGPNCWRARLPADFEAYLAGLSKSHRKQLRRLKNNVLDTPRARWRTAATDEEFEQLWPVLVDLHQRRRRSLGERGSFASLPFAEFHYDVARQLLAAGRLRLHVLELDDRPIAAEYHFRGGDVVYGYQSGLDPSRLEEEPGRLAGIAVVRQAIADGCTTYDLLRGDEPYKAHWRAEPTPTEQITIVAPRAASRLRYAVRQTLRRAKRTLSAGGSGDASTARGVAVGGERHVADASDPAGNGASSPALVDAT